jgi:hypothetical protein
MPKFKLVALFAIVTVSVPAAASDLMRDMERFCTQNAQKYCPNDIADPKALIPCMLKKREKLSPKCQPLIDRAAVAVGIKVEAVPQTPPEASKK